MLSATEVRIAHHDVEGEDDTVVETFIEIPHKERLLSVSHREIDSLHFRKVSILIVASSKSTVISKLKLLGGKTYLRNC